MLLDAREETRAGVGLGEDDRLAAEGAALGAADVKSIGQAGQVGQGHVVCRAREGVGQAGTVDIEGHADLMADGREVLELSQRVKGAILGRLRDIDGAGLDLVLPVGVLVPGVPAVAHSLGGKLAVLRGKREHLVARELDRASIVYAHMPRVRRHHTLPGGEQRVDHDLVGLRAAAHEMHLGIRAGADRADLSTSVLAEAVGAIAGNALHVGLDQGVEHRGMRTLHIVRCECELGCRNGIRHTSSPRHARRSGSTA